MFFARWFVWAASLLMFVGWLRGAADLRQALLMAGVAAVVGLLASVAIGSLWPRPRPLVLGLGHAFMAHAPNASFPGDHLTFWWSVAFSLSQQRRARGVGIALALLGFPIAWARICVGVHFPLDMAGAAGVAACSALATPWAARWYLRPVHAVVSRLHHRAFARLITRGWVRA